MDVMTGPKAVMTAGIAAAWLAAAAWGGLPSGLGPQDMETELVKKLSVPGDAGWVDTGMDVKAGEELVISASGEVSLQRGNPAAACGPAGLDLVTVDQPIPNENLGALVGKVAQFVASRQNEDTGGEVRDEILVLFFVGPEKTVRAAIKGRLYLGVNEKVTRDNGGEFAVVISRRPA